MSSNQPLALYIFALNILDFAVNQRKRDAAYGIPGVLNPKEPPAEPGAEDGM
jgi:hypothetical protein